MSHAHLRKAEFGFPGTELRRSLVAAILRGEKTATAGLLVDLQRESEPLVRVGERQVVVDADDREVAIIETTEIAIRRMADVDLAFARDEGEGFESVAAWRAAHERFFGSYLAEIRADLDDPSWELNDDTLVVCERFRVVERIDDPDGSARS